ncbi:MAG: hypothetical protein IKD10_13870 [Lentisphaeria bacterium]|nr:hypothetical protein [Lentisphaeria bacterium]
MEKFFTITAIDPLLLTLPEDAILSRLGRNRYLSVMEQDLSIKLHLAMQKAFALCHARGRWKILPVTANNGNEVVLNDSWRIQSSKFAEFLCNSKYTFLGAVTIGNDLPQAVDSAQRTGNIFEAAIFDAVGSECADLAIGLLQKLAAAELLRYGIVLGKQRFSAGYGNVELFHQQEIFQQLQLHKLDMQLTQSYIMQPEKSVTAFATVNTTNFME